VIGSNMFPHKKNTQGNMGISWWSHQESDWSLMLEAIEVPTVTQDTLWSE
jgi:hypothetical protein